MDASGWTQVERRRYLKAFGEFLNIYVFPNLYADADDGQPMDKSWAMSANAIGIGYHKLSTDDLEKAKIEAVEFARQRASDILSALNTVTTKHRLSYCTLCQVEMVRCHTCGNNCCNGGYGKVDGENCPDCPNAYDIQDLYGKNPELVVFEASEPSSGEAND